MKNQPACGKNRTIYAKNKAIYSKNKAYYSKQGLSSEMQQQPLQLICSADLRFKTFAVHHNRPAEPPLSRKPDTAFGQPAALAYFTPYQPGEVSNEDIQIFAACCTALGLLMTQSASVQADVFVDVTNSTGSWNGFMNVFDLTTHGDAANGQGSFAFGSGWGLADLSSSFDDVANQLTLSPNSIADPNSFWYQNTSGTAADPANPGGPGQLGNKFMEANLFQAFGNAPPGTGGIAG